MISPKVINLFGGPGSGKSTCAAYVFSKLKMAGINVELVTEFAKDKTWEHNAKALGCQPYVFGKQCYRIDRCADQVDVIVTDSPLLLSALYNYDENIEPEFTTAIVKKFNEFDNYNYFLERRKEYDSRGRNHTEEEAKELDVKILNMLNKYDIKYKTVEGIIDGFESIIFDMKKVMEESAMCDKNCKDCKIAEEKAKEILKKCESVFDARMDFDEFLEECKKGR